MLCKHTPLFFLLLLCILSAAVPHNVLAEELAFEEFFCNLPDGWDGNERVGFISRDREEYMLTFVLKDSLEENYLAFISLYLLPNKPGKNSEESALALAREQADASKPVRSGPYWVFTGNPRDKTLPGMATTYVASNAKSLLIIIVKDPGKHHADDIIKTLRPRSERARALLEQ